MLHNNICLVLFLLVAILIIIYISKCKTQCTDINEDDNEHFAAGAISTVSNEAIANVSSIYNNQNMSVSNLTVTGGFNSNGMGIFKGGTSTANPQNYQTVFPFSDGKNYIRGDTELDGNLYVPGNGEFGTEPTSIKFTNGWSGWPDVSSGKGSEISNDMGGFKTLMIVGNRAGVQSNARTIGMWDNVQVNGNLNVTGIISSNYPPNSSLSINQNIGNPGCWNDHCNGSLDGTCEGDCGEQNNHNALVAKLRVLVANQPVGFGGLMPVIFNNTVIPYWYSKTGASTIQYGPFQALTKLNTTTTS
jgi:hypothetical protein